MREYAHEQVSALLSGPKFFDDPVERVCPACDRLAVRTYVYHDTNRARALRITYSWCASCRRFKGWTGPNLGELEFSDPLAELTSDERRALEGDMDTFFGRLDALWEEGELPQHFKR
jgi:hypothetical protein